MDAYFILWVTIWHFLFYHSDCFVLTLAARRTVACVPSAYLAFWSYFIFKLHVWTLKDTPGSPCICSSPVLQESTLLFSLNLGTWYVPVTIVLAPRSCQWAGLGIYEQMSVLSPLLPTHTHTHTYTSVLLKVCRKWN